MSGSRKKGFHFTKRMKKYIIIRDGAKKKDIHR